MLRLGIELEDLRSEDGGAIYDEHPTAGLESAREGEEARKRERRKTTLAYPVCARACSALLRERDDSGRREDAADQGQHEDQVLASALSLGLEALGAVFDV